MPLLDHFHPPISSERRWESFHNNWAGKIADRLMDKWLPPNYVAEETAHIGPYVEVDVATLEHQAPASAEAAGVVVLAPTVWTMPAAALTMPSVVPDTFEVRIVNTDAGPKLVAAIELVSPSNKESPRERRAFAAKCAGYLYQGISLIVVDLVTSSRANLHNELIRVMETADAYLLAQENHIYAVAYRPLRRGGKDEVDIWPEPLRLGADLPTLPLGLSADLVVPVELEMTYAEACRRKKLIAS